MTAQDADRTQLQAADVTTYQVQRTGRSAPLHVDAARVAVTSSGCVLFFDCAGVLTLAVSSGQWDTVRRQAR